MFPYMYIYMYTASSNVGFNVSNESKAEKPWLRLTVFVSTSIMSERKMFSKWIQT